MCRGDYVCCGWDFALVVILLSPHLSDLWKRATLLTAFREIRVVGILTALAYHIAGGIRHLLMDLGHFEELESGAASAKVALPLRLYCLYWRGSGMVKHVSSFGRNGVRDYLLIRASAIILVLYTIYIVSFARSRTSLMLRGLNSLVARSPKSSQCWH